MPIVKADQPADRHAVFYYPYASFASDDARLLLRIAAFYFDQLFVLDPVKAIGGGVRISDELAKELHLLEAEQILVRITPEQVLAKFEAAITAAVKDDLADPSFVRLCQSQAGADKWTLAMAKVPKALRDTPEFSPQDRSMQKILGEFPRELSRELPGTFGGSQRFYEEMLGHTSAYNELGGTVSQVTEFRYVDLPLAVGESIMVNHALFGSLLYTESTPVTIEDFHDKVLRLKIERARLLPAIQSVLEARAQALKQNTAAIGVLADQVLDLPILDLAVPFEEVLEARERYGDELTSARRQLALLAGTIRQEPWTPEFQIEVGAQVVPAVAEELRKAGNAIKSAGRGRLGNVLSGLGVPVALAAAVVPLVAAPAALPIVVVTVAAALTGASSTIFGIYDRWKQDHKARSGLQYLLRIRTKRPLA